jgi:transposase
LIAVVGPLLKARQAIEQQTDDLDRKVLKLARYDAQVRRFMTVPGVGRSPRSVSRRRSTIRPASSDREVLALMSD